VVALILLWKMLAAVEHANPFDVLSLLSGHPARFAAGA